MKGGEQRHGILRKAEVMVAGCIVVSAAPSGSTHTEEKLSH